MVRFSFPSMAVVSVHCHVQDVQIVLPIYILVINCLFITKQTRPLYISSCFIVQQQGIDVTGQTFQSIVYGTLFFTNSEVGPKEYYSCLFLLRLLGGDLSRVAAPLFLTNNAKIEGSQSVSQVFCINLLATVICQMLRGNYRSVDNRKHIYMLLSMLFSFEGHLGAHQQFGGKSPYSNLFLGDTSAVIRHLQYAHKYRGQHPLSDPNIVESNSVSFILIKAQITLKYSINNYYGLQYVNNVIFSILQYRKRRTRIAPQQQAETWCKLGRDQQGFEKKFINAEIGMYYVSLLW